MIKLLNSTRDLFMLARFITAIQLAGGCIGLRCLRLWGVGYIYYILTSCFNFVRTLLYGLIGLLLTPQEAESANASISRLHNQFRTLSLQFLDREKEIIAETRTVRSLKKRGTQILIDRLKNP